MRLGGLLIGSSERQYLRRTRGAKAVLCGDSDHPDVLWPVLEAMTCSESREGLLQAAERGGEEVSPPDPGHAPFTYPRLILGIGLNYPAHAESLQASVPTAPASFLKGTHTIIGGVNYIEVPPGIGAVTAEAELGILIGRTAYKVSEEDAMSYVAGVFPLLDQTAETILLENPRFLTRAKNYPTFFSFGPEVISLDEVGGLGAIESLEVSTCLNGTTVATNRVRNMTFSIPYLISFHSTVMPLRPGDIISTGTPGAVEIHPGDVVQCRIDDIGELTNRVVLGGG